MESIATMKLSDLVIKYPDTAEILEQHRFDFCCGGGKTLDQACIEKGLATQRVSDEIYDRLKESVKPARQKFDEMSLDLLIDYICASHHAYVRRALPLVQNHLRKVEQAHGKQHPELAEVLQLWEDLTIEMTLHMRKEEDMLFPYIQELVRVKDRLASRAEACFRSVRSPISVMEFEHERAGRTMERIAELTNRYEPPEDACTTYRLCLEELSTFEKDLHKHVHLENNMLFPKSIEIENQINQIQ